MKKILIGLAVLATASAQAQTSTTAAPAAPNTATVSSSASTTQTLTTSTSEASQGVLSKVVGEVAIESAMGVKSREDLAGSAPITTLYALGASYKLTSKLSAGFLQYAYTRSNFEGLKEDDVIFRDSGKSPEFKNQVMFDFAPKVSYKSDLKIAGSDPISMNTRFMLPTSSVTKARQQNGTLRGDATINWVMNPQWSLTAVLSPRITFNQDDSAVGSDTIYRLVSAGIATYNFNDNFNLYGAATGDQRSVEVSRGAWGAERGNVLTPELGANLTVGKITINPAISSDVNLSDSSASIGTENSRIFASETTSYNLNLYATF